MKKFLLLIAIVISVAAVAQKPYVIQVVTDTTAKFNKQLFSGQFIYTTQDQTMRVLKVDVGPPTKMSWVMYSTSRYDIPATTTGSSITTSGNVSIGGTLGVTGATTLSAALGGTTGVFSGSLSATTLNTGQGANELYDMDQNVMTTSSPEFTGLTVGTATVTTAAITTANAAKVTVSGLLSSADTTGIVFRDAAGVYWRMRVSPTGVVGTFTTTTP